MLQSQSDKIVLLPALSTELKNGSVKGIRARGGFELEIDWKDEKLLSLKIISKLGNACYLIYGDKTIDLETVAGKTYAFDGDLNLIK